jgi:hypothetical protein
MAQTKLTKTVAHADKSEAKEYELRDTIVAWISAEGHARRPEDLHASVSHQCGLREQIRMPRAGQPKCKEYLESTA